MAFPVVGFGGAAAAILEMRRNNVFRQNLKRTFLHAHGFSSDLRYVAFCISAQPLLLWVLEAVTFALLLLPRCIALRNSLALDYCLTHFLPWPQLKAWLVDLIWEPSLRRRVFYGSFYGGDFVEDSGRETAFDAFKDAWTFWQSANYVIWSLAAVSFPLAVGRGVLPRP